MQKLNHDHLKGEVLPLSHCTDNPKYLQSPFIYLFILILCELRQHNI